MQELAQTIVRQASVDEDFGDPDISTEEREINEAAKKWAAHALGTYKGKLLQRALSISSALADFTAEIQRLRGNGG